LCSCVEQWRLADCQICFRPNKMLRHPRNLLLLSLLCALVHNCNGAVKARHQEKHSYTNPSVDVKEDLQLWRRAFGSESMVSVKDTKKVFKKHFDMIHDGGKARSTGELHDIDDGSEFAQLVKDTRSWSPDKMMTFDEFWQALQEYVQIKIQERAYLSDFSVI